MILLRDLKPKVCYHLVVTLKIFPRSREGDNIIATNPGYVQPGLPESNLMGEGEDDFSQSVT
ncbi:hypothetical protein Q6301_27135, partial [Klebsiella quasipneumoniae]|uniref:hypothetical protein n=1 Tax=Klebsiella quasipneumoniae TaxID=1463165 RepID=UPI002731D8F6